jgi:hypothetical protein
MTFKNNNINPVQFNSGLYYLCAGAVATKPLQRQTDRQHRNVKKVDEYRQQMKTHRQGIMKITPENNSINNIMIVEESL